MLKGYAVNQNAVSEQKYEDLKRALGLLENVFGQNLIMAEQQAKELFAVVKDYTYALDTLVRLWSASSCGLRYGTHHHG